MGVQPDDYEAMRAPFDFIGVNLYMRACVRHVPDDPFGLQARAVGVGGNEGPRTDFGWEIWPRALSDMVLRLTRDYDRPVLEITENGCSYGDAPDRNGVTQDDRRIDFYRGYLEALSRAIDDGARVSGYHAWSLLDNFEWAQGYGERFGLAWMDFESGRRTLKESGRFYGEVADRNGFET